MIIETIGAFKKNDNMLGVGLNTALAGGGAGVVSAINMAMAAQVGFESLAVFGLIGLATGTAIATVGDKADTHHQTPSGRRSMTNDRPFNI